VGYDDNPAEVTDSDGSGVARYHVFLKQSVFKDAKDVDADLFFDGVYEQYFDLDDNYRLQAGATLESRTLFERFLPGLFAEATAWRDVLVPDDERDELTLGGFVQWLVGARLTLSLQQSFAWTEFQNGVSFPGQRHYFVGKGKGSRGHMQISGEEWVIFPRDDDAMHTELTAVCYLSYHLQTDLSFLYRDVVSSDVFESFQEWGYSARIEWFFSEALELFMSGFWSTLDYDNAPQSIDRKDEFYGLSAGGKGSLGEFDFFIQFDQTINQSFVDGEDFRKVVVQCGASYAF
jgi:hypothetical protein